MELAVLQRKQTKKSQIAVKPGCHQSKLEPDKIKQHSCSMHSTTISSTGSMPIHIMH
jgi:hypothetical protein